MPSSLSKPGLLVLSLLFVFISHGQITHSINGMVVSDYKTPSGNITVQMPDDLHSGKSIQGTVIATPAGKNEKEQKKNLEKMLQYSLAISGTTLGLKEVLKDNSTDHFSINIPSDIQTGNDHTVEMKLTEGSKNLGTTKLPVNTASMVVPPTSKPLIHLQDAIIAKDNPYLILRSPNADLNQYEYLVQDKTGQYISLLPVAASSREAVVSVPSSVNIGSGKIMVRPKGSTRPEETQSFSYSEVETIYQIGKQNLQKGETTLLKGTINGLDERIHHSPTLVLENVTNNTIDLERGNNQAIYISLSNGGNSNYNFERMVTGITPGPFTINANLYLNPKDISEPFHLQARCLQNVKELNEWVQALKYDLAKLAQQKSTDALATANSRNAELIRQNLEEAVSNEDLDMTKVYNENLLRYLVIDQKELITWDSYFVSGQASVIPIKEQLMRISNKPVDWEMVKLFCENIEYRATIAGYRESSGALIDHALLEAAVRNSYSIGSDVYNAMIIELYTEIVRSSNALPDEYLPRYNRPDPVNDFIAFLDPVRETLWTEQQYVPVAISQLGATKRADGKYSFIAYSVYGNKVAVTFSIVTTTLANMRLLFKPLADVNLNNAGRKAIDSLKRIDSLRRDSIMKGFKSGDRIVQDTDKVSKSVYRLYKNAKCVEYYSEFDNFKDESCIPETSRRLKHKPKEESNEDYIKRIQKQIDEGKKFDYDPYEFESYKTGRYLKYKVLPMHKCGAGNEYCTEIRSLIATIEVYDDKECTVFLSSYPDPVSGFRFVCKPN